MMRKFNRFIVVLFIVGVLALIAHSFLPSRVRDVSAGSATADQILAQGVVYRAISTGDLTGVNLIDVDLYAAKAKLCLGVSGIKRGKGGVTGRSYTPEQWLVGLKALAAVNGGYFGDADAPDREHVVGLLVLAGKIVQGQSSIVGRGGRYVAAGRYVRSAFGITATGAPSIAWVGTTGSTAMSDPSPTDLAGGKRWHVREAIGCGPTLIANGRVGVTDHEERLVSEGDLPRTFVAYDTLGGKPRHFVMGVASSMTFQMLSTFIAAYFKQYHSTKAARAMCFDGGPSSQLSYRGAAGVQSPLQTDVAVPVALVLVPRG